MIRSLVAAAVGSAATAAVLLAWLMRPAPDDATADMLAQQVAPSPQPQVPRIAAAPPPAILDVIKLETIVQARRAIEGGLTTGKADETRIWRLLELAIRASNEGWDPVPFAASLARHQVASPKAEPAELDKLARIDTPKGTKPVVIYMAPPAAEEVIAGYIEQLGKTGYLTTKAEYRRLDGDGFEILSAGADGEFGTQDDVTTLDAKRWRMMRGTGYVQ